MGNKARDMLKLIPNIKIDVVERCAGHGGTFGVMKETHDLAIKVGRPTARQIKNKNNKYMTELFCRKTFKTVRGRYKYFE